jgi:hypothetical protein
MGISRFSRFVSVAMMWSWMLRELPDNWPTVVFLESFAISCSGPTTGTIGLKVRLNLFASLQLNALIIDRSLTIKRPSGHSHETTESLLSILHQLAEGGCLKNNQIFILKDLDWSHNDPFIQDVCSMKNLEKLDLLDCEVTRKDLLSVFRSCPKLMELRIKDFGYSPTLNTIEQFKEEANELELDYKRLRLFDINVMMEQLR